MHIFRNLLKFSVICSLFLIVACGENDAANPFIGKWVADMERSQSIVNKDYSKNEMVKLTLPMMSTMTVLIADNSATISALGKDTVFTGEKLKKSEEGLTLGSETFISKIDGGILLLAKKSSGVVSVLVLKKK